MTEQTLSQVYLARHGETEWNASGRRQGRLDSPLTEPGVKAAYRVAETLKLLPIDAVFSSPLGRASTTAAIFGEALDREVVLIDGLAEIDHGEMSGLSNPEIERTYPGELARRLADLYEWRFPGGESYADADRRAVDALREIALSGCTRPLVVSHEMVGRMLLRHLLCLDPIAALGLSHPHDVIYRADLADRELVAIRSSPIRGGTA